MREFKFYLLGIFNLFFYGLFVFMLFSVFAGKSLYFLTEKELFYLSGFLLVLYLFFQRKFGNANRAFFWNFKNVKNFNYSVNLILLGLFSLIFFKSFMFEYKSNSIIFIFLIILFPLIFSFFYVKFAKK